MPTLETRIETYLEMADKLEYANEEIKRLKDENAVLSDECIRDTKTIARLNRALRNIVDNVHSRIEMYNRAKQALKEGE